MTFATLSIEVSLSYSRRSGLIPTRKRDTRVSQHRTSDWRDSTVGFGLILGTGIGATIGLILAGGAGLALGAAFGAAGGVVLGAIVRGLYKSRSSRDG